MPSAQHVYQKYRNTEDAAGDAAWAAKLAKRAVWLPEEDVTQSQLLQLNLSDDEKVLVHLLRLPRRYADIETSGVFSATEIRRFLRALHASEVLETQDLEQAKPLVPIEITRARQTGLGKAPPPRKPRKLRAQVYRPSIDAPGKPAPKPVAEATQPEKSKSASAPKATQEDAGPTTQADMALEREIDDALRIHRSANHFDVMGVGRDAITDEIKEAYFNLAKRFHPDRVAGYAFANPDIVEEKIQRVFARISEAYRVLQDPDERDEYMQQLDSGAISSGPFRGRVRRSSEASIQYKKGMVFLNKKELAQAQRMFQMATELDHGEPVYPSYLAWSRYLDERLPLAEREKEALEKLEKISAESPCAEAAYFLGMVLKLRGDSRAAHIRFQKTVELNPAHNEALREVRLYELRHVKQRATKESGSKSGLIDRLLKK